MPFQEGKFVYDLADADTAGGVLALTNPEGRDLYITRLILNVTTKSSAAGTVDAGVPASGSGTSDNLIDGLDVGTAAGVFDNIKNAGSNGKAGQKWGASQYLTISKASGAAAGLEGQAIVEWVLL